MFISSAYAQAPAGGAGDTTGIFIMIAMFVGFYFLMIRPQKKRAKEHQAILSALAVGDEVITNAGILAKVAKLGDNDIIALEIAHNVEVQVQRAAVAKVLPKGTLKSL